MSPGFDNKKRAGFFLGLRLEIASLLSFVINRKEYFVAYTVRNYRSKKELKDALKNGERIRVFQPGLGEVPVNGTVHLEGPHYPQPQTWYAEGKMLEGFLVEVK